MSIKMTLHHCETTSITASTGDCACQDGRAIEWITLDIGEHDISIFMPIERARLLAAAVNAAEAEWQGRAKATGAAA